MKVVTEILQDLEILKRLLKHNANLKIRINYYLTLCNINKFNRARVKLFRAILSFWLIRTEKEKLIMTLKEI